MAQGCGGDDSTTDTGPGDTGTMDTGAGDTSTSDTSMADTSTMDGGRGSWECLGMVDVTPVAATAVVTGRVADFTADTGGPGEAGVEISFCERDDTDCMMPITATTSDIGEFEITLPTDPDSWWGFATANPDDFPRHVWLSTRPIFRDTGVEAFLINTGVGSAFVTAAGETQDWGSNGLVGLLATDCESNFSPGVRFEVVSGSGTLAYVEGMTYSTDATQTDRTGTAIIANAVPGDFEVAAFLAEDDTPIGAIQFTVLAGEVTTAYMDPTPDGGLYTP
jgi:hypothetical protein